MASRPAVVAAVWRRGNCNPTASGPLPRREPSRMLARDCQGICMGHRLSKIVTRTGDAGTTGLGDGSRVAKDSARIAAIGEVDELNAALGLLLTEPLPETVAACLT